MAIHFSKKPYKVLSWLYHEGGRSGYEIKEHFKDDQTTFLIALTNESYIAAQSSDGRFPTFEHKDKPWSPPLDTIWFLLPKGEAYVEDRRWRIMQWLVPVIISATAVIISITALANSSPSVKLETIEKIIRAVSTS